MTSVDITYRGVQSTPEADSEIHEQFKKMESIYDRITTCHVVINPPAKHHRKGDGYNVHIQLSVPRKQIVVDHANHNPILEVAIRDAFKAARRQLTDYTSVLQAN